MTEMPTAGRTRIGTAIAALVVALGLGIGLATILPAAADLSGAVTLARAGDASVGDGSDEKSTAAALCGLRSFPPSTVTKLGQKPLTQE